MYIITHPHRRRAPGLLSTSPHPQGLTGSLLGLITPYQKLPQVTLSARSGLGNSYSTAGTGTLTLGVPPATIVKSSQVKSFDFFDLKEESDFRNEREVIPAGIRTGPNPQKFFCFFGKVVPPATRRRGQEFLEF